MNRSLKDYSYDYPEELIAKHPLATRDMSRLLVLEKSKQKISHESFKNICDYFSKGDVIVFNNSKVFPCRLLTKRKTGGKQEIFLVKKIENDIWLALVSSAKKVRQGDIFEWPDLKIEILDNSSSN